MPEISRYFSVCGSLLQGLVTAAIQTRSLKHRTEVLFDVPVSVNVSLSVLRGPVTAAAIQTMIVEVRGASLTTSQIRWNTATSHDAVRELR